jgi:hypothetical protein
MNKFAPFLVGAVVLIGLIVYFAQNQNQFYRWAQDFEVEGKNPYDMKVLYNLLETRFDVESLDDRIDKELSRDSMEAKSTTYLYIGKNPKYTEDEAWHLREYVRAGGEAFIITEDLQDSLAEVLLYAEDCSSMGGWTGKNPAVSKDKVYASFSHPSINDHYYQFEYVYEHYPKQFYWNFIPMGAFCDNERREHPIASLGSFVDKEEKSYNNFVRLEVGKGRVYIHTNPIMFTNMFMVDSAGFEYANYVFSHINNKTLYWDRESLLSPKASKSKRADKPALPAQSPLEYIFSQPSLRWSWYMFMGLGLIYIVFGAKRRQRKIPILETNRNTSLEFVETIGLLYFQQQDHKGIIKKQMHLFLAHMRQRYNLVTRDLDDKLITRISVRSKVDRDIINDIFAEYFKLRKVLQQPNANVSVDVLNNFYLLIERFHTEVKKTQFVNSDK